MRTFFTLSVLTLLFSSALPQRRVIQGRPNRPNRNQANDAVRLGLLANQIGVQPVPGSPNSPLGGFFQHIPGGAQSLGRDDSCWCQPINQVCTALRPENLDLVTRIINRPGSPGSFGTTGATGCNADQRFCCPSNSGRPPSSVTVSPQFSSFQTPPGTCGVQREFGINGISPVANHGEYPWMAVIMGQGFQYIAGGVLISDSWVLTAPHKLTQSNLMVRLGDYDVANPNDVNHFEVPVVQTIIHPRFNAQTLANDVALLRLAQPVPWHQFPHIAPACLPAQGQIFDGQRCFVSGWGRDAFAGSHQTLLQEVDVPVIDSFRCQNQLRNTRLGSTFTLDRNSFICAGGEFEKDACQGDGGSPMVCPGGGQGWTIAGLVAWGIGCGEQDVPAAYVNVASFSNFIRQHVR